MIPETENITPPEKVLHDTLNQMSSVISIAQYCLIGKEVPPEIQTDLRRIIDMTKEMAANLKRLAQTLEEKEA